MAQGITDVFPVFLDEDATNVAQKLLGCHIILHVGDKMVRVMVVETESYDQYDAASHSHNGRSARTDVMFGTSGHLYVYFTYGMHYCCNIVTGKVGDGQGVLIRAAMPVEGIEYIEKRRGKTGFDTTNGPAKLCQALNIDKGLNGHDLRRVPLRLATGTQLSPNDIVTTPRIGITKAREALRRFYIRENPFVSNGK